jgi:hypothetical protein
LQEYYLTPATLPDWSEVGIAEFVGLVLGNGIKMEILRAFLQLEITLLKV